MVGLPLEEGFEAVFADLSAAQRRVVLRHCEEAEHEALARGGARLLPGALEVLGELRRRGVRMGIASNCAQPYLDAMLKDLRLSEFVRDARCLDTPGVRNKADMVRGLLEAFGTRSAVMVGDRRGDAQAAHANGLPHVHLRDGFASPGEQVDCEAEIGGLGELLARLEGRGEWIEGALRRLGCLRTPPIRSLGITGRPGAGKTLFARDAARRLLGTSSERADERVPSSTRAVSVVALDDYRRPAADRARLAPEDDPLAGTFDLEGLLREVLEPHSAGAPATGRGGLPIPGDALLVLEGPYLLHPRVRLLLDRVVHLEASEAVCLARLTARGASPRQLEYVRETSFPAQRAFERAFDPESRADLVLPSENALGPPSPGEQAAEA